MMAEPCAVTALQRAVLARFANISAGDGDAQPVDVRTRRLTGNWRTATDGAGHRLTRREPACGRSAGRDARNRGVIASSRAPKDPAYSGCATGVGTRTRDCKRGRGAAAVFGSRAGPFGPPMRSGPRGFIDEKKRRIDRRPPSCGRRRPELQRAAAVRHPARGRRRWTEAAARSAARPRPARKPERPPRPPSVLRETRGARRAINAPEGPPAGARIMRR